MNQRKLNRGKE